jgi:glycosyltransferase involved in cell wall biosynthesis
MFRASVYRAAYPDLAGLTLAQARRHYFAFGRAEGRLPSLPQPTYFPGYRPSKSSKPFIFLVAHEASRTGAPILALALIPRLSQFFRVVVILRKGGELEGHFRRLAEGVLVFPSNVPFTADLRRPLSGYVESFQPKFCIVNSAEAAQYVTAMEMLTVPCVFLVHEFSENVGNKQVLDEVFSIASTVVFPAEVVAESHLRGSNLLSGRTFVVKHQGFPPTPAAVTKRPLNQMKRSIKERSSDTPIVLGLGSVISRKGVDLFIEVAHYVVNRLDMRNVKFVWMGQVHDQSYENELREQIRKLNLETHVEFAPPVDDLSMAIDQSSLLLVSSRQDPFPNVAIESLICSTPVVSFDGATGISEWLKQKAYSRGLAVPFLDAFAAAETIADLLSNQTKLKNLGAQLGRRARIEFDLDDYVDSLIEFGRAGSARAKARFEDVSSILESGLFDFELFTGKTAPPRLRRDVVTRYVQLELNFPPARGAPYFVRRAIPGLNVHQLSELSPIEASQDSHCALARFVGLGNPEGDWYQPAISVGPRSLTGMKISTRALIHLHLHYPDLLDDFLSRLRKADFDFELFVTTSSRSSLSAIKEKFLKYRVRGTVKLTRNFGRDLVPFMDHALPKALSQGFDVVAHLHTKKSLRLRDDSGTSWREFLWTTLIGSRKVSAANHIVKAMSLDETIGLVFPSDAIYCGWDSNLGQARNLMSSLGLPKDVSQHFDFPVGTMFWARTQAIRKLSGFQVSLPPEPLPPDGTQLHALERLIPSIVKSEGFSVRTARYPGIQR